MGRSSRYWLYHSLKSLKKSLNNNLSFYNGDPLKIIPKLISEYNVS